MPLQNMSLRKLLKIMFLPARAQQSALRTDIREERAREAPDRNDEGGGDFYAPFWSDAKAHAFGQGDLRDLVAERIANNGRRARLYPLLRDGFLLWWTQRRRWTNQPFQPGRVLRARHGIPALDAVVKVDSIMSVRDADGVEHYVYPYFAPEPPLSDEGARLALWLLGRALPDVPHGELRILDVIRGRTFSIDRFPLRGDEEAQFHERYAALLRQRDNLREGPT